MKKLNLLGLAVALAAVSTLAGCELYFGGHDHNNDTWNYCGSDGEYQCQGNDCQWVSPTCTSGNGSGSAGSGSGSGYECGSSTDCAAGCYCDSGTCTEGGFCSQDSDCGDGYHCNTDRSSCEPNPPGCNTDSDCASGSTCDASTGQCTATCACMTDADAVSQGYGYCDETRGTCMNGSDPNGSCAGTITCTTAAPTCPSGQVPTIFDGCYTGNCEAIAACDAQPVCANINDESDCLDRTDCAASYTGINCHKPDGSACHTGDTDCTCSGFQFSRCSDRTAAQVTTQDGVVLDPAMFGLR